MKRDDRGVDTIFGALILILACMITSAAIISIPDRGVVAGPDAQLLEAQFDCILSSSIELSCPEEGEVVFRTVSVSVYLIEITGENRSLQSSGLEDDARAEISSVIDFYMSRFDGWLLQLSWEGGRTVVVTSRSPNLVGSSDTYVLERSVPDVEGGSRTIRLMIAG